MSEMRPQTELIRQYVLKTVRKEGSNLGARVSEKFGISRQAAHRHLQRMTEDGLIEPTGKARPVVYRLADVVSQTWKYDLSAPPEEHLAWEKDMAPHLQGLPRNVFQILQFGFTEMFNNAVDHSGGTQLLVSLTQTALQTRVLMHDDGVGIFSKIKQALGLEDERQSVLELAKGKFTTDPSRHSGEGIFFTSRMFHPFLIVSDDVVFSHESHSPEDWVWRHSYSHLGTTVFMEIENRSRLRMVDVFSKFTSGEEKDFSKTIVPVRMAQYGGDQLISRSQAKRVVAGLDKFSKVILDFQGVDAIGQGFSDEIFRVFQNSHPDVELNAIHCVADVQALIDHVRHGVMRKAPSAK